MLVAQPEGESMTKSEFMGMVETIQSATGKLISLVPEGQRTWRPYPGAASFGELMAQMVCDCETVHSFFMNTLTEWNFDPNSLDDDPKSMPTSEAIAAWEIDRGKMLTFLGSLSEREFHEKVLQAPWGQTAKAEILLHIFFLQRKACWNANLYLYLKMIGIPVDEGTLYYGANPGTMAD